MMQIEISVLMSVFNEPIEWLSESIDSILNQSFTDLEFIIINDNPKNLENIQFLKDYQLKDKRIILLFNDENLGITRSLNKGLKIAKGKYIARMDADDISMHDRLYKQFIFLENNENIAVCGTWMINFDQKSKKSRLVKFPLTFNDITNYLFVKNPISHPTVMIRSSVLKKHNLLYDVTQKHIEDHYLWCELAKLGEKLINFDSALLKHRVSDSQISTSKIKLQTTNSLICKKNFFYYKLKSNHVIDDDQIIIKSNLKKSFLYKKNKSLFLTGYYLSKEKFSLYDAIYIILSGEIFLIKRLFFIILMDRLGVLFFYKIYIFIKSRHE
jgi:glycosyltransferase involved in cell wall biosynthesis